MPSRIPPSSTPSTPSTGSAPNLPAGVLKTGAKGEGVKQVQLALVKLGFFKQADVPAGPGTYGPKTIAAVKAFQQAKGLDADGEYGPKTRKAIETALAAGPTPAQPGRPTPGPTPAPAGELKGIFYSDNFEKRVALTFDDGPHPVNTPKILDILKEHKVKATFFVTGENAKKYPELIKRIVAEGHTLGSHSQNHTNLATLDAAQVKADLASTQKEVDKALGRPYKMVQIRPPYGSMDAEVKDVIRGNQTMAVMWTVDSNDWKYRNDDAAILKNVFEGSSSVYSGGGVVLFHDIQPQTVRVLGDVLKRMQREDFKIVKTDKFLAEKYPELPNA